MAKSRDHIPGPVRRKRSLADISQYMYMVSDQEIIQELDTLENNMINLLSNIYYNYPIDQTKPGDLKSLLNMTKRAYYLSEELERRIVNGHMSPDCPTSLKITRSRNRT